jgi:hypothetical protein
MEEVERSVVVPGLGRLGERGGRVRKSHHCECTVGDDASVCRAVCALVISLKRDPRRQVGNEGCSLLGRLLHHGLAQTGDLHPPAPPAVLHRSPPFPPRRTASKRQREADRGCYRGAEHTRLKKVRGGLIHAILFKASTSCSRASRYMGTSLIRNGTPPWDHHTALDIVLV